MFTPLLLLALVVPQKTPGPLVLDGGGGTPDEARVRALELTGADAPSVVVLPQASSHEDRGQGEPELWERAGAASVHVLQDLGDETTRARLEAADLIWFPGGGQTRLMEALRDADLVELITSRHADGVVIGGSSAGASAMSAAMISGSPDPGFYRPHAMKAFEGLGLWPEVIIDQHFTERGRYGRLVTAVLDRPDLPGVGLDEGTAVIVHRGELEVLGRGAVTVIDARGHKPATGKRQSARGVELHLLAPGERWRFR